MFGGNRILKRGKKEIAQLNKEQPVKEPPKIEMVEVNFSKTDWQESAMQLADACNDFLFDAYSDRELPRFFVMGTVLYIPAYFLHADTAAQAMANTVCTNIPAGLALRVWTAMANIEGFQPSRLP